MSQQVSSTEEETATAVKMFVVDDESPPLHVGRTVTILNHTPSGQTILARKNGDVNNTTSNIFQPPCGSGKIIILKREPSSAETTGAVKMAHFETTITMVNESPSSYTFSLLPTPPPQSPSKKNRIPLSGEIPNYVEPEFLPREYAYKNGTQYPVDFEMPKNGTILRTLLETCPMIEIVTVRNKESKNFYNAICHSCQKEYKSCSANDLYAHTTKPMHKRRLAAPRLSDVDAKEHSRRQLLISNPKFTPFLQLQDDQTLWCKWCNVQLPFTNSRISTHRYTTKHLAAASETEHGTLTEAERLKVLQKIVDTHPDALALVTEFDKKINDEYFEPYKRPDQITLQVNDLYCKICRQKINSINPLRYYDAVKSHLKSKRHLREVEAQASILPGDRRRPPKKITTFRHDPEDLKELARVFTETKLPITKCDVTLRKVTQATIHRRVSTASLKKVIQSIDANKIKNKR